jgi:hypothetical protein
VPREAGLALLGGLLPNQVPQPPPPPAPPVEEEEADQPANNVKMADLNALLENCSISDDDGTICNRIRTLVFQGNKLSKQFREQDIQDLLLFYVEDRPSFDKLFPLLGLDENPTTNVMQKIVFRADPVKKAKHNRSVRQSQQKRKEERRAAQQNM